MVIIRRSHVVRTYAEMAVRNQQVRGIRTKCEWLGALRLTNAEFFTVVMEMENSLSLGILSFKDELTEIECDILCGIYFIVYFIKVRNYNVLCFRVSA